MKCLYLLVSSLLLPVCLALLRGHQQQHFQSCLQLCLQSEDCDNQFFTSGQPLHLRLLSWDCTSECRYRCMWITETTNRELEQPVYQYYGKWPFRRVLGIQEFGSMLLSVGNMLAHWYGYNKIYMASLRDSAPHWFLHRLVYLNYVISLNGWFWSTIFHSRDTWVTQYLDYFSAIAIVFGAMLLALTRSLNLYSTRRQLYLVVPVLLFYLWHVHYMIAVDFDFSWNMKVALTAALTFSISFLIWSVKHLLSARKRPHAIYSLMACLLGMAAGIFEVFDFSPKAYFFDAHAMWHAATIPIIVLWYQFYCKDAHYDLGIPGKSPGFTK